MSSHLHGIPCMSFMPSKAAPHDDAILTICDGVLGRGLPSVVAFINFLAALRQRIQPWIDRLLQWKEASDEWWGVRNERCATPFHVHQVLVVPRCFLQAAFCVAVCST